MSEEEANRSPNPNDKTIGQQIIAYLPAPFNTFTENISPLISISVGVAFFLSAMRVFIEIEAGVLYDILPLWAIVLTGTPLFIGPLLIWVTNIHEKNNFNEYLIVTIVLNKILLEILPWLYLKLVFATILIIESSMWIIIALTISLEKYSYSVLAMSIASIGIIDVSLRAPTLGAEPAMDNNWFSHTLIILVSLLFGVEALVLLNTNNKKHKEKEKEIGKTGLFEGMVLFQGIIIYYLFYGNTGLISQGFQIPNSTATLLLLGWYLIIALTLYYIGETFRDPKFYSLNYGVIIPSAVVLLASTYTIPWSNIFLYPAPFFASLSLFFIIERATLTSKTLDIKKLAKGTVLALLLAIATLLGYIYFENMLYVLLFILIFDTTAYLSIRNYRRLLNGKQP